MKHTRMIMIAWTMLAMGMAMMTTAATAQQGASLLGTPSRLQLSVSDLMTSMVWYARLGFSPVNVPDARPDSLMYLTDGQVVVSLVKQKVPSPVIIFRAPNLKAIKDTLDKMGVACIAELRGPGYGELRITSPSGIYISVRPETDEPSITRTGQDNAFCGRLGEWSIGVPSLTAERQWWADLGFKQVDGDSVPYPFAIMSDGAAKIGLHQGLDITTLAITYFSKDAADRIDRLRKSGMEFDTALIPESASASNAALRSADGQLVFVFTEPSKP
jgi:hypothetical protein